MPVHILASASSVAAWYKSGDPLGIAVIALIVIVILGGFRRGGRNARA